MAQDGVKEPFDYKVELDRAMLLFPVAATIRIEELEEVHSRAEILGPLVDPTKYVWGGGARNLEDQRDVLAALGTFVRAARKLRERQLERLAESGEVRP